MSGLSGLARSPYYRRPDPEGAQALAATDAALQATIEAITGEFPGYGYRRVTQELRRRGTVINHKRVARVMHDSALAARPHRRFVLTTNSARDEPVFPNLLRDVQPDGPNQVWVAGLTYLRLGREFAHLAVILDAWSLKVRGGPPPRRATLVGSPGRRAGESTPAARPHSSLGSRRAVRLAALLRALGGSRAPGFDVADR